MRKNISKISILAWLALLLFVFSCGSEKQKEVAEVAKKTEFNKVNLIHKYNESAIIDRQKELKEKGYVEKDTIIDGKKYVIIKRDPNYDFAKEIDSVLKDFYDREENHKK